MAQLFNARHGLEDAEMPEMSAEAEEDAREERVFRTWINSLGLDGCVEVRRIVDDLRGKLLVDDSYAPLPKAQMLQLHCSMSTLACNLLLFFLQMARSCWR